MSQILSNVISDLESSVIVKLMNLVAGYKAIVFGFVEALSDNF